MFGPRSLVPVAGAAALLCSLPLAQAGVGTVARVQKVSQTQGGRTPVLDNEDQLGRAVTNLGDLVGDGILDLAAAGHADDDGGLDQGAAYVLFLRADGLVRANQKISELAGGFAGRLDPGDQFGRSLAGIGDLDGDGIPDLAAGANFDDDGGMNRGAVWLLCLNRDGTVKRTSKISSLAGGFAGPLRNQDEFGRSVTALGDLDGDGLAELAVGAPTDNTGGTRRGAVWVLFLARDGSVRRSVKIAFGMNGFTGRLRSLDWFGFAVAPLGDFDRDGVPDLIVGSALDDDGAVNAGAVWLLYMRTDGLVKDCRKISMRSGGFTGLLESPDQFGTSVAALGDVNRDGITDVAVGAVKDSDGGKENGSVYVLFLSAAGTVASHQKISDTEGDFPPKLDDWDWLGSSLAPLGDFNRDGTPDFAVGARNDDDGGSNRGALYLTFLRGAAGTLPVVGGERSGDEPPSEAASSARRTAFTTHGRHAEPEGSLELVSGEPLPGSALGLRMRVPEPLVPRGGRVRLLVAGALSSAAHAERSGLLVDPARILAVHGAAARPGQEHVELRLSLPDEALLRGQTLAFQALWDGAGEHARSDALELSIE